MRERMLLASLLDKLADLLNAEYELQTIQTDEIIRYRREVKSLLLTRLTYVWLSRFKSKHQLESKEQYREWINK
jgi:hypothetical protein